VGGGGGGGGGGRILVAVSGLAALTASQGLYGHPQALWFSLLVEVSCVPFLEPSRDLLRRGALYLSGKTLGFAAAAIQLLPTADAYSRSLRALAPSEFFDVFSLRLQDLLSLVGPYLIEGRAPGFYPHESVTYSGTVPLALLAWMAVRRHRKFESRRFLVLFLGLAAGSLVFAFGPSTIIHPLQRALPLVGAMRAAGRARALFQFALALVTAVAFVDLLRASTETKAPWRRLWPLAVFPFLGFLLATVGLLHREGIESATGATISGTGGILLGPALLLAGAYLVATAARGIRLAAVALPLLAAGDLAGYGLVGTPGSQSRRLSEWVSSIPLPPDLHSGRIATRGGNELLMRGAQLADGYAALLPVPRLDWMDPATLRVAGVRWIRRHLADSPDVKERFAAWDEHWYEVGDPIPRVRLVVRTVASDRPAESLAGLDFEQVALVERPIEVAGDRAGRAWIVRERPGEVRIATEASSAQLLVLADSFHPGWTVAIDGAPATVERVNGQFLGCRVPAGAREIAFAYRPRSRRVGGALSIAAAATIVLLAAGGLLHHTPQSSRKLQRGQLDG